MATKTSARRKPAGAPSPAQARALGVKFGRAAAKVERRQQRERPRDERSTPAEFVANVEELAFWELSESGHAARWYIENRKALQRAFYAGARSAAKAPTKRPARTRNPAARKKRCNPSMALTPAKAKALGAGFGAKAARELVKGQNVGDLEMDERVYDRPLLAVLLDDTEQYATAYLDDMEGGDVTMAIENAPNSKALWSAFSRGVASTAKPVLAEFIAEGRARLNAVVNPSKRRRRR